MLSRLYKRCLIACGLVLLVWAPASSAETLLDITLTGAEMLSSPSVVILDGNPQTQGDSLILTSVGESYLVHWGLLLPAPRDTLVVKITVDFDALTPDNDLTFGLFDFFNDIGYMRADNSSGSLFRREGPFNGQDLPSPPIGPIGPTGLGTVQPFTMTYVLNKDGGPTAFAFNENGQRHTDEFTTHAINEDQEIFFYIGGGNNAGETYQINSVSIQVSESLGDQGLAYFPLTNCRIVNTTRAKAGHFSGIETREFRARGETTDFSSQGGSAQGCGIPNDAEAVMANFLVFDYEGQGFLRVGASDKPVGGGFGSNLYYNDAERRVVANATILDLCDNNLCLDDFQVETRGKGSRIHLVVNVMGYFAPIESSPAQAKVDSQELWRQLEDLESHNLRLERDLADIKSRLGLR